MKLSFLLTAVAAAFAIAVPHGAGKGSDDRESHALAPRDQPLGTEPIDNILVTVRMGSEKRNIGRLQGGALYDQIYKTLEDLCPEGRGKCFVYDEKTHKVEVEYKDNHNKYAKGTATFSVFASSYDGPGSDKIMNDRRRLMFGAIAGAYEAQAKDPKNCYQVEWGMHCNIGSSVHVNIGDSDSIHLAIDSPTKWHHFDCEATRVAVGAYLESLIPEISGAYHNAYMKKTETYCPLPKVDPGEVAAPVLAKPIEARNKVLTVTIGNEKQNIGGWDGKKVYDIIKDALNHLCPEHELSCPWQDEHHPRNIEVGYINKLNRYKTGPMHIWVEHGRFSNPKRRELLINTIATVVSQTMEVEENCFFHAQWPAWKPYVRHCNIARFVGAELDHRTDILDAHFEFWTTMGGFSCSALRKQANAKVGEARELWTKSSGEILAHRIRCPDVDLRRSIESGDGNTGLTHAEVQSLDTTVGSKDTATTDGAQDAHVIISLGRDRRNVGKLVGVALHDAVYTALDYLCPKGSSYCKKTHDGHPEIYKIDHIAHVHDMFLGFSPLEISVEHSNYTNNDAIRRLMIRQVAGTLWKMSELKQNCYKRTHGHAPGIMIIDLCNVGSFVGVNVRDGAFINVRIGSWDKDGTFDCEGAVGATHEVFQGQLAMLNEFRDALGGGEISKEVFCIRKTRGLLS